MNNESVLEQTKSEILMKGCYEMKGDHADTVDMVRDLLRQGKGMIEIMNFAKLSSEEFTAIKNKLEDKKEKEFNDRLI